MRLYTIVRFLAMIFCKILFHLEAKGKDNIPKVGGFILASNHASYLDPIVLAVTCPRQLNFMARDDLFSIPILNIIIRNVGAFPIKRNYADIASIKQALQHLQQSRGLLLFPEGSRTLRGFIQKPQPGIGFVAAKSGLPVVPAFVHGSRRAFGRHARFIRPTKIKVYFGSPIYPERIEFERDYEHLAAKIMQEIERLS